MESSAQNHNYWTSAAISGGIFGVVYFVMPLIAGYIFINNHQSGALGLLVLFGLGYCLACLIGALGGGVSVWHYSRENATALDMGRGALIGFITGVIIIAVTIIFNQLWTLVDPQYQSKFMDSIIAVVKNLDLPQGQQQLQIDSLAQQYKSTNSLGDIFSDFLIQAPIFGLLNLVTGMIGAKLFGSDETEMEEF